MKAIWSSIGYVTISITINDDTINAIIHDVISIIRIAIAIAISYVITNDVITIIDGIVTNGLITHGIEPI